MEIQLELFTDTKFYTSEFIKKKLNDSYKWRLRSALVLLKETNGTMRDGCGLNSWDFKIINFMFKKNYLTEIDHRQLKRILPKYSKQLSFLANNN